MQNEFIKEAIAGIHWYRLAFESNDSYLKHSNSVACFEIIRWLETIELSPDVVSMIDRFVRSEVDFTSAGRQGIGPVTDALPHFGDKYRDVLSKAPIASISRLSDAFAFTIAMGFLLGRYMDRGSTHKALHAQEEHFAEWAKAAFSQQSNAYTIDRIADRCAHPTEWDESMTRWAAPAIRQFESALEEFQVQASEYHFNLWNLHFNAGLKLFAVCAEMISKSELLAIADISSSKIQSNVIAGKLETFTEEQMRSLASWVGVALIVGVALFGMAFSGKNQRSSGGTTAPNYRSSFTQPRSLLPENDIRRRIDQDVEGYTKSSGTTVAPYYRTRADSTDNNNYSVKPNVNPHTGKPGTRNPQKR